MENHSLTDLVQFHLFGFTRKKKQAQKKLIIIFNFSEDTRNIPTSKETGG